MLQRLDHREVGIPKVHVLANDGDVDRVGRAVHPVDESLPLAKVGLDLREAQDADEVVVQALPVQRERHLVDRR